MNYTDVDVSRTLGETIARMRAAEDPTGDLTNRMGSSIPVFDMHDATHILFGCDTSLQGEIAAHIWMLFGTTVNVREMHRAVAKDEHKRVLGGLGHVRVLGTWLGMVPQIIGIIGKTRRMTKRVDFNRLDELKTRTIATIWDEHGIARS